VRPNWLPADRPTPAYGRPAAEALTLALLLAVTLGVWSRGLAGPFQFDDWNVIVEQPAVHSLAAWWASMPGIRPLLKLSYALDWQAGRGAAGFHLTNLLLHAANVVLVWRLARRWPGLATEAASRVAFAVALVFALHPVQAESGVYVSGRSMSLMAAFWLGAFLCWLQAEFTGRLRWRAAALACFAAALAVRETALALPLALWLWQRAGGTPWRQGLRRLWPLWAMLLVAALGMLATTGYRRLLAFSFAGRSPLDNLAAQVDAYAYLLVRPLWLLETNIDPAPAISTPGSAAWWACALAIAALLAGGLVLLRRAPLWGLAILWPFALLLPTNSLVPRLDLVADRHLYLALIGPAILVTALVDRLRVPWRGVAVAALACVLAAFAWQRAGEFSSETALWTATATRSPAKARVWNNLGYGRLVEGDPAGAADAFRRALAIDPGDARAAVNLERAEAAIGRDAPGRPQASDSRR
jgi:hypothetical protein